MTSYIVFNISSRTTPRLTFMQSKRKYHTDSVVYTSHNLHIGVSFVHLAVLQARICSPDINLKTTRTMMDLHYLLSTNTTSQYLLYNNLK